MPSELEIALRCQWLTGSYEGSTLSCNCPGPKDCVFNNEKMFVDILDYPKVQEAKRRKLEEYWSKHA